MTNIYRGMAEAIDIFIESRDKFIWTDVNIFHLSTFCEHNLFYMSDNPLKIVNDSLHTYTLSQTGSRAHLSIDGMKVEVAKYMLRLKNKMTLDRKYKLGVYIINADRLNYVVKCGNIERTDPYSDEGLISMEELLTLVKPDLRSEIYSQFNHEWLIQSQPEESIERLIHDCYHQSNISVSC